MNSPRIILNMIVKNEEKVIGRCLESTKGFTDAVVVSDTEASDGTVKIVEAWAKECDVPCFIDRQMSSGNDKRKRGAFRWPYGEFDFGTARTYAARAAKFWAKERGWPPGETYLLFLDADMMLVREEQFERSMLREAHYRLMQRQGSMVYPNTRLGRLDFDWFSCEPTHEYWAPNPDRAPAYELFSLWIDDRDDGGSKGDKYDRDARLLRKRLEEDPKNVRAMYYLAQTYYYMAEKWFEARSKAGDFEGERWYAELMLGKILAKNGRSEEAILRLIDAAESHPHRSEPLADLATIFRAQGKNHLAYSFALIAAERDSAPKSQADLFVDRGAFWKAREEISIASYYLGKMEEGWAACEEILRQPGLGFDSYEQAARNLLHYLPAEYGAVVRRGKFDVPEGMRVFPNSSGEDRKLYLTSSPSIIEREQDYLVNIRLVNYDHERGRWFVARHADGVIRTENALLSGWHPDGYATRTLGTKISAARIPESWPKGRILGLEDLRLHEHLGDLWFTATTCQVPGAGDKSKVILGTFDDTPKGLEFEAVYPLKYGSENEYEKNWLPWSLGGILYLIYGYEPFTILEPEKVSPAHFECRERVKKTVPFCRMARYRGSTSPVSMADGSCLMLIHEVVHRENDNVYLHRFIELDPVAMLPTRVSEAFTFHHHGVEYAAGMARSAVSGHVIVTYGSEERESHWCEIDTRKIRWMVPAKDLAGTHGN